MVVKAFQDRVQAISTERVKGVVEVEWSLPGHLVRRVPGPWVPCIRNLKSVANTIWTVLVITMRIFNTYIYTAKVATNAFAVL
jgi:hypothetical protein